MSNKKTKTMAAAVAQIKRKSAPARQAPVSQPRESFEPRLSVVETKVEHSVATKEDFAKLDRKIDTVDRKVDKVDGKIDKVDIKLNSKIEHESEKIRGEMRSENEKIRGEIKDLANTIYKGGGGIALTIIFLLLAILFGWFEK